LDKKTLEEIEARLLEVNEVVKKLDESIRVAAFEFLKPYIVGGTIVVPKGKSEQPHGGGGSASGTPTDLPGLVEKFGRPDKPSDNARLLSAWWFSQYGGSAFTTKWIEDTAASTGLTVPASLGMTFKQAKAEGKLLYKPLGKGGLVEPTVAGESFLQKTYGLKKGTQTPPTDDNETK
jgi:hypothetical protein